MPHAIFLARLGSLRSGGMGEEPAPLPQEVREGLFDTLLVRITAKGAPKKWLAALHAYAGNKNSKNNVCGRQAEELADGSVKVRFKAPTARMNLKMWVYRALHKTLCSEHLTPLEAYEIECGNTVPEAGLRPPAAEAPPPDFKPRGAYR